MTRHELRLWAEDHRSLLIGYGLPVAGGVLVAVFTTLLFAFVQRYLL